MSVIALLTPSKSGDLTLPASAPELKDFADLFAVPLKDAKSLGLTNAKLTTQKGNKPGKLTADTTGWDGKPATVLISFTSARIELIRLTRTRSKGGQLANLGLKLSDISEIMEFARIGGGNDGVSMDIRLEATSHFRSIAVKLIATARDENAIKIDFVCRGLGLTLDDVVHLVGNDAHRDSDLRWLPEHLRDASIVRLEHLVVTLDKSKSIGHAVTRSEVHLAFGDADWQVLPGMDFPTVGNLKAELSVDHPLEPDLRFAEISLSGTLHVAKPPNGPISIQARWPDLSLIGHLEKGKKIELSSVLSHLGLPTSKLPSGKSDALAITKLDIVGKPFGENKNFGMDCSIDTPWRIQLTKASGAGKVKYLALQNLSFNVYWDGSIGHHATLSARCVIEAMAGIALTAKEVDGAWVFSGRLQPPSSAKITVGKWLQEFADSIGAGITLPDLISGFVITDLLLSLDTAKEAFSISITGAAAGKTAGKQQKSAETTVHLLLNAERDNQGKFAIHTEGTIRRGDLYFELIFDHDKGNRLIALLGADKTQQLSLPEMANTFGLGSGWPNVSMSFNAALAAFESKSQPKAKSAKSSDLKLAAVDLGAGINLAGLPLVGELLSKGEAASVTFQLCASSRDLVKADNATIATINERLPKTATPLSKDATKIKQGLNLSALVKAADFSQSLALPIKTDTPPKSVKPGKTTTGDAGPVHDPNGAQPPTSKDGVHWKNVDKHFGPLHLKRVGMKYANLTLDVLVDGALAMGPVTFSMTGLSVSSKLKSKAPYFDPTFNLKGLGLDYKNGPLEISGAFLRDTSGGIEDYAGAALLKTEDFSLSALGIYSSSAKGKSLFLYGVLDQPLGGPAFFFVTGLAAGLGYNRALKMPALDEVADFPLVKSATRGAGAPVDLSAEINNLRDAVPVAYDEYFVAVGIKFNSFKLIDSFALLMIQFGKEFELDLLGLSTVVLPPPEGGKSVTPIARIQVALKATFRPDEGILRVDAALTDASFLFSKACKLEGGFAFYAWFKDQPNGPHAGEFVVSLGGYHPLYDIGSHPDYPRPKRVGVNWPVSRQVQIKGNLYAALTPSAIMAGGHIEANFHDGGIRAWFKAGVDFLMMWKPFHYDARIYVDIGGSYTFEFLGTHTITIDVGADVHIWGPEFAGNARVHLYIISFDVPLGSSSRPRTDPLKWDKFMESFLPPASQVTTTALLSGALGNAVKNHPIDPAGLLVQTDSAIPASEVLFGGAKVSPKSNPPPIGIASMHISPGQLGVRHEVTVSRTDFPKKGRAAKVDTGAHKLFVAEVHTKLAPAGLWGKARKASGGAAIAAAAAADKQMMNSEFIGDTPFGCRIRPKAPKAPKHTQKLNRETLIGGYKAVPKAEVVTLPIELDGKCSNQSGDIRANRINKALADKGVDARRASITDAFQKALGNLRADKDVPPQGASMYRAVPAVRTDRVNT